MVPVVFAASPACCLTVCEVCAPPVWPSLCEMCVCALCVCVCVSSFLLSSHSRVFRLVSLRVRSARGAAASQPCLTTVVKYVQELCRPRPSFSSWQMYSPVYSITGCIFYSPFVRKLMKSRACKPAINRIYLWMYNVRGSFAINGQWKILTAAQSADDGQFPSYSWQLLVLL